MNPLRFATSVFLASRTLRLACVALAAGTAGVGASGCSVLPEPQADPTRYYLLAAETSQGAKASEPQRSEAQLHLALRVVELPGYLRNNRTLVIRSGVNEVIYQDYARWAEPLDLAVQRIVRDRLLGSARVATAQVAPFSAEIARDFDITVRVLRCEGGVEEGGRQTSRFSAVYEIADTKEGRVLVREVFDAPAEAWDGRNYAALAQHLSAGVAALGEEIVAKLPADPR